MISSACIPFTDMLGETREGFNESFVINVSEKWVHFLELGEVDPVCKISHPDSVSRSHDPVGTGLARSVVNTSELSLVFRRSISHEASCVSGKSALNLVRNASSDRL